MYSKILIANRGEIAVRILRACRELGIGTVAVYSEADQDALHVLLADEAICIGPASATESYLKIPTIIAAAEVSGAQAIHPGYGFLSENSDFAEKCITSNIDFIGPDYRTIEIMGNKLSGRKIAEQMGIPTIPGTMEAISDEKELLKVAEEIGFPLMIKAKAGGGGKGMRIVHSKASFIKSCDLARAEARAAFDDDEIFIEKFLEKPRHIEVQVLGDKFGQVVHLGERDCSLQRRNQKIIEEAPAIHIPQEVRKSICAAAIKLVQGIDYYSAGTVEFLVDKDYNYYFIEMNTRLQVEHPVTEMITGVDLVSEQIKIAAGEKIALSQKEIKFSGHAIECRITAEDPENFGPSPGQLVNYREPGGLGIRLDSGVYPGYSVKPYYDSLIAKLISFGENHNLARRRMVRALAEYQIEGIKTLMPLQYRILNSLYYTEGKIHTSFVEDFIKKL